MPVYIRPLGNLMFTFTREGEVLDQQIAGTPARLCQMAVVFLATLGALQAGDRFDVTEVEEA